MVKMPSPAIPAGDNGSDDLPVISCYQEVIAKLRHEPLNLVEALGNARWMMGTPDIEDLFTFLKPTRRNLDVLITISGRLTTSVHQRRSELRRRPSGATRVRHLAFAPLRL
jgi:hypothetical protein